jgi:RNA polymerase sigma factor (TIGR02999 family)
MNAEGTNNETDKANITWLLQSFPQRQEELFNLVYSHLKEIARNRLAGENRVKSLQTTALVNEAYIKLADQKCTWRDRRHFYGVAAEAMRRILIDAARSRNREKRGAGMVQQSISGVCIPGDEFNSDFVGLHQSLAELEQLAPEKAEIVKLKFFSGLTLAECAQVLEISLSTVERHWRFARAWLRTKIQEKN